MSEVDIFQTILNNTNYHLSLFSDEEIDELRSQVFHQQRSGKDIPFIKCVVRKKEIQLTSEEIVRQLYAKRLMKKYEYASDRLAFEYAVNSLKEIILEMEEEVLANAGVDVFEEVFGIDLDEKTVPVAHTLNLIAGDIKESRILHQYDLGFKAKAKHKVRWGVTSFSLKAISIFLNLAGVWRLICRREGLITQRINTSGSFFLSMSAFWRWWVCREIHLHKAFL